MVPIVDVDAEDPAREERFLAWSEVLLASARHDLGELHSARTPRERRAMLADPNRRTVAFASTDDAGEVVGAAWVAMPLRDNLRLALLALGVHPDHRGQGHGAALLEHGERLVRHAGRSVVVVETQGRAGAPDEGAGFAERFGYAAAQTNLRSSLALPVDRERLVSLLDDLQGDGYALETRVGGIPEAWVAPRAELGRRMSTDVPLGDLQLEEEHWDVDRVRAEYAQVAASGRTAVDTFAFAADGTVAGYTQTTVPEGEVVYQQDTLVLREHRGHRLGLRLKAANTLTLVERFPDATTVRTWNADDNAPMLAVNRELGYVGDAFQREWQKELR